ncbi:MAG: MerC domain-containing protein [Pedobacter sp.]|nr:MAG: MerC domain-containing protein [Pedobacter sp.]
MKSSIRSGRLDQFGMTASIACAVHCAVLPLVVTFLPLIGLEFLANMWVEITMIVLSAIVGVWSLLTSFTHHKSIVPSLILILGFVLIANGHFIWHEMESIFIPLGGIAIAFAHYVNWRLSRLCTYSSKQI